MRILGWSIEAFGFLENVAVRELPDGLTVFYGSNEVVKRTILTFVRGGLFGFDDSDCPLAGGGGKLFVNAPNGQFTVERHGESPCEPRILHPDGTEGTPAELAHSLGGIDRFLFDSVFVLRQRDVQALSKLDARERALRIASVPTIGTGEAARCVAADLGERSAELLAPASHTSIGKLVSKIRSLRSQLDSARRAAVGYRDLRRAAEESAAEVARLREVLNSSAAEQQRCETLRKLSPAWTALQRTKHSLQALEPIDDLPADLETRLTLATARRAAAAGSLQSLREQQAKDLRERREREPSSAFELVSDSVEDLYASVPHHRERLGNLNHLRVRWERAKRAAEEKVAQLGTDWDIGRLSSFDVSRPMGEEARAWQRRLSHAAEDEQRARQALDEALRRREMYERQQAELSEQPRPASIADAAPFDVRLATARLSTNLAAFPAGRLRAEVKNRIVEERERLLRTVELGSAPAFPGWSWMVPWLALLGAAVVTVERGMRGDWKSVLFLEVAVVFAVGAAFVSRQFGRRAIEEQERRRRELEAIREDLEDAQRQRDAYWLSNVALQRVIAEDSATLGLESLPASGTPIPALPRSPRNLEAPAGSAAPLRNDVAEALEEIDREISLYSQRLSDMRALASRMEAEWTAWKAGLGLPARLSPEGVSEFLAELREAQLALVARDTAEDNLRELEVTIEKWELRARTNLTRAAMPVGDEIGGEALIEELTLLRNRCVRAAQERSSLVALDAAIEDRSAQIATAEAEIRQLEEDRAALLRASGCVDEADFHRKRRVFEERSELKRIIREHEARLASIAEADSDPDGMLSALVSGTDEDWRRGEREAEARIQETRESLRIAEERDRQAREACRVLEESDEIATLEARWAEARAELSEAVRYWRVIAVAQGLMEESIRDLEQAHLPSVLAEASSLLSTISVGRFRQIVQESPGKGILMMDRQGRGRPIDECDEEMATALYLSLRLGMIADFSRRHVCLPLAVDDIIVGLAPDLARGFTAALGQLAQQNQVLFFTCDPETCVLLADHARAARIVQI